MQFHKHHQRRLTLTLCSDFVKVNLHSSNSSSCLVLSLHRLKLEVITVITLEYNINYQYLTPPNTQTCYSYAFVYSLKRNCYYYYPTGQHDDYARDFAMLGNYRLGWQAGSIRNIRQPLLLFTTRATPKVNVNFYWCMIDR